MQPDQKPTPTHFTRGWLGHHEDVSYFRKRGLTRATRIVGPFTVETREGALACDDGWLAWDANGDSYPIAADVFEATYAEVDPAQLPDDPIGPSSPPLPDSGTRVDDGTPAGVRLALEHARGIADQALESLGEAGQAHALCRIATFTGRAVVAPSSDGGEREALWARVARLEGERNDAHAELARHDRIARRELVRRLDGLHDGLAQMGGAPQSVIDEIAALAQVAARFFVASSSPPAGGEGDDGLRARLVGDAALLDLVQRALSRPTGPVNDLVRTDVRNVLTALANALDYEDSLAGREAAAPAPAGGEGRGEELSPYTEEGYHEEHQGEGREFDARCGVCDPRLTIAPADPEEGRDAPARDGGEQQRHGMVPGSHERPSGPECLCGAAWSRWDDSCACEDGGDDGDR